MQLLVQNCLDPSRATEIFSVLKRRIFALLKIVRYRNKSGLQYTLFTPNGTLVGALHLKQMSGLASQWKPTKWRLGQFRDFRPFS